MMVSADGRSAAKAGGGSAAHVAAARLSGGLSRNLAGERLAEAFLLAAVATVLAIRGFLAATGYPQAGGSTLHIAHLLWGGLGMLVALLSLLLFVGSRVRTAAAWIGGVGFGAFIDELGKFLTQDNDYFFRPAVALIYALFVIVFLVVRYVSRRRPPSRAERLAFGYAALTDLAMGRLRDRGRQRALAVLGEEDDDDQVSGVRSALAEAPAPAAPPSRWIRLTRLTAALGDRLHAAASDYRVRRAVIGLFFLLAGGVVTTIVIAFARSGDGGMPPLNVVTIGSAVTLVGVGLGSLLGAGRMLRGDRVTALRLFYGATLVSLFVGQFVAFIAVQFVALASLAVNVLVLVALRAELHAQKRDGN